MPTKIGPEENAVIIRFGGGVNSAAADDEINERECTVGENFILDAQSSSFKVRKPFDLLGTAPNGSEIRGFANLLKSDGSVSMLVQAGTAVYEWDGAAFSASKGTVSSTAKLRGPLSQNWELADEVIITDLNLQESVKKWDGSTLTDITFTDELSAPFGTFKARYCIISNERVMFANVHDNGSNFPHLIVGAKRGDYTNISVSQRPASALSEEDPFFLIQPDYKYINGMAHAFGTVITSSKKGILFKLTGSSAKDFAFDEFYAQSGASGDEGLVFTGNDMIYGRQGRIESVKASDKFGDTENDDLSIKIKPDIESYDNWTLIYNQRKQRIYCFADNQSVLWVLFKPLLDTELSPWVKWRTFHASSFQPTAVMSMLDPSDGLEYVYFGDTSGNLYRMEGSGAGDGGTESITAQRTSASFSATLDAQAYQVEGWLKYATSNAANITVSLFYNGSHIHTETKTVTLSSASFGNVYNGGNYYSNQGYYSQNISGRIAREKFDFGSGSEEFQTKITYFGTDQPEIIEIGTRFEESS